MKWQQNQDADGYVDLTGVNLRMSCNGSVMVYGKMNTFFTGADRTDAYYLVIEAFNANGISDRTENCVKSE